MIEYLSGFPFLRMGGWTATGKVPSLPIWMAAKSLWTNPVSMHTYVGGEGFIVSAYGNPLVITVFEIPPELGHCDEEETFHPTLLEGQNPWAAASVLHRLRNPH